jgi:SAM-dependent methyltransferase
LIRQSKSKFLFPKVNGSAILIPFSDHSFDLIIIQDVIEHLDDLTSFLIEIRRVLKHNGVIYLSTPNRDSIFNIINDPHFGLPIVSLLKRDTIKKYFLKYLRKEDFNRSDIAQLLSLDELMNIFDEDFKIMLNTKFSVQELINGNKGIVWSNFHLKLVGLCKLLKLDWVIYKLSNNRIGTVNKFFTPTHYLLLTRKI